LFLLKVILGSLWKWIGYGEQFQGIPQLGLASLCRRPAQARRFFLDGTSSSGELAEIHRVQLILQTECEK
jgi:hypothetical protein